MFTVPSSLPYNLHFRGAGYSDPPQFRHRELLLRGDLHTLARFKGRLPRPLSHVTTNFSLRTGARSDGHIHHGSFTINEPGDQSYRHWRIEGTIRFSITMFTVPSTLP